MKIITKIVKNEGRIPKTRYSYYITVITDDAEIGFVADGSEDLITDSMSGSVQALDNSYKFGFANGTIYKIWSGKRGKNLAEQKAHVAELVRACIGQPVTYPAA